MASEPCTMCGAKHEAESGGLECILVLQTAMRNFVTRVADKPPERCRGKALGGTCDVLVYMIRHNNGAWTPYTERGIIHFVDCPDRALFHRGNRGR